MSNFKQYQLTATKFNKHSIDFQCETEMPEFNANVVKIEKFQGFSKATGCKYYFRVKNQSSWANSKQITGLWRTPRPGVYSGDIKSHSGKTLILFKIHNDWQNLTLYLFPNGFNPVWQIGSIVETL